MNDVYLSIGTNMGEREQNLRAALEMLAWHDAISLCTVSAVYETTAVGYTNQADFLNIAVHLQTTLRPQTLLEVCQNIEQELGRVRNIRWGPRVIDLDILLYNHENIETETLIVPHPRMYERAFVLVPLMDVIMTQSPQIDKARQQFDGLHIQEEGVRHVKQQQSVASWLT
ncbi:2-amino-4-hydroxy-6-hydroxymethyldihydropteridine pyrophosphokinase [Lysinibacillus alkalisoli]|uniref:2-amino-4-hydroxy-6-hydroxymethyldihydropteridine diphosphokinase n=1 Tax=Lysinibacillus alkalisoli TaxID=1911548 RepID=A0A917LJN7_9BACI|nr:2-amino-4-hydroxy-6-hydroxymethyldihydropteridine diphosphokinase [Lysinibacillus alkalisoli]GGG33051.1 2-amino-4-hydroxy-6-hydroxymethyldihydropteridine pyrophosphokinase [Lysinibacillus alkalisoli]